MAALPPWLLVHEATIEPYEGDSATGPIFGDPVTVRCFVDEGRTVVRDDTGRETVSSATLYAPLDTAVSAEDRVTVRGRTAEVLTTKRRDGGGLPTPDHIEVSLR